LRIHAFDLFFLQHRNVFGYEVYASNTLNAYPLHLIFLAPCRSSCPQGPFSPQSGFRQSGAGCRAVCASQCPAAHGNDSILWPRDVHVDTVDIGLWRLQLQRRPRRCTAGAVRLLPHASRYTRSFKQGYHFGAARSFRKHDEDGVSTMN
jgi:hypothetical protein